MLVLYGGRSAEHEVSIVSARFIVGALDGERFEPVLVGIHHDGHWSLQPRDALDTVSGPDRASLAPDAPRASLDPYPASAAEPVCLRVDGRDPIAIDAVFPVLHGPLGEDGATQGLFELIGLPYVGSGVASSAVAMDKVMQKQLFVQHELPIVPYVHVRAVDFAKDRSACLERAAALGFPMFVKPANMGSSLGISRVADHSKLEQAIEHALEFDTKIVIEQGLDSAREIECAVLGNDEAEVSLPGEIVVQHDDGFYSYDAKYIDADGAALHVPAQLSPTERSTVQLLALRAFRALDCAGLARVDMFLSRDGELYVNEVNTMPGFTAISMYPALWNASGVDAATLVARLVDLAFARHAAGSALRTAR